MKLKTILLLAGTLLLVALSAGAEEGRAIAVLGEVTMLRGGQSLAVERGTPIEVGDRIRTGDGAAAQLRMSDESILSVRQKSEVEITSYRFAAEKPEEGTALFSLIKGGLRTLTGKIGVYSRPNYKVNAVDKENAMIATIGIRGTHFRLQLCDKDCESAGAPARDGLYGGVTEGRIAVSNDIGETEFGVDEYFFLADAHSMPELLPAPPDLLNDRLAALAAARKSGKTAAADSSEETAPVAALSTPAPMPELGLDNLSALTQIRPAEDPLAPTSLAHIVPIDDFVPIGGAGDIRGQIIWMSDADIDLHLLAPTAGHVYYGNQTVDLGNGATAQLDHDNLGGTIDIAPDKRVENIKVTGEVIPLGDYAFYAHSFSGNNGGLPTTIQIRVTGDGSLTTLTDNCVLAGGQTSSNYIVDFRGKDLTPQYRIEPQAGL